MGQFNENNEFFTPGINGGQWTSYEDLISMLHAGQLEWIPGKGWSNIAPAADPGPATNPNSGPTVPPGFDDAISMEGTPMGTGAPGGMAPNVFQDTRPAEWRPRDPSVTTTPDGPFGAEISMHGTPMGIGAPSQIDGGQYTIPGPWNDGNPVDRPVMDNQPINPLTGEMALDPNGNPWPWTLREGYEPPPGFRPGDSPRGGGQGGGGGGGSAGGGTWRPVGTGNTGAPLVGPGHTARDGRGPRPYAPAPNPPDVGMPSIPGLGDIGRNIGRGVGGLRDGVGDGIGAIGDILGSLGIDVPFWIPGAGGRK